MRALMLSCVLLSACSLLAAQPPQLVELEVVSRASGQVLPRYPHRGENWIAGAPGERYALRISNRSGERVLAVLSVDGVNVISGESAASTQSGYVLEPYGRAEIAGWRKSMNDVAAFYFTTLPDSYAARTGRPHDVGVIGLAAFRERPPAIAQQVPVAPAAARAKPASPASAEVADAAGSAGGASSRMAESAASAAPTLGTGHGERQWAPTRHTSFERATSSPEQVVALRYDARERLLARGIIPPTVRPPQTRPRPFPAENGFVPDPS
ncbi:MAG: hypothetical protein RKP46_13005 [Candidatus Accumulibacter sp.]|uniref:hypothetical protein n=1 Tax=Accumulibacter sp. TaxID=2053492 RepID=UPI002879BDC5|nr:hypothetical protein [Accumulibacter sp.]MDS4015246.1 hypothetical protein [Accumulibacter sp.]